MKLMHWVFPSLKEASDNGHEDIFGCWRARRSKYACWTSHAEKVTCAVCLEVLADIVEKALDLNRPPCPACRGSGVREDDRVCTACRGSGLAMMWNKVTGEAI